MSRLNAEIKNMKRTLILEKAAEMFEAEGFGEMKVSLLAKEVGVSVGSIYAYFDSKEGLYSAWVSSEINTAYTLFSQLFKQEMSFSEMLKTSIRIKFALFSKKRKTLKSGVLNNPFFFEAQQLEHKEALEKLYGLFIEPIEKIKSVDIDAMQLVYILNSVGNTYVIRWIEGDIESLEDKVDEMHALFMNILQGQR